MIRADHIYIKATITRTESNYEEPTPLPHPEILIICLEIFHTRLIFLHAHPHVLQLCKVSSVSVHSLRRSCTYNTFRRTYRRTGWSLYTPTPQLCLQGI